MKKHYYILFLLFINFTLNAQENPLFKEVIIQKVPDQAGYILNFSFDHLEENDTIRKLEKKYNSALNSISSCTKMYVKSNEFRLSKNEMNALENRMKTLAERFYNSKRYTLLKDTSGMSPIYGINVDTIAKKQVFIVLSGGGCVPTKESKLDDEISAIFNVRMNALLHKKQ